MNEKVKKLSRIGRRVNLDAFFSVSIDEDGIRFLGWYDSHVAKFLSERKFAYHVNSNGSLVFTRGNLVISLTSKDKI